MPKIDSSVIMDFFISKGLTAQQSAGIVGNLVQESGLDSSSPESNHDSGFGLARWTWPPRKVALEGFAVRRGVLRDDPEMQLEFIWHELTSQDFTSTLSRLKHSDTVEEATTIFCNFYERPGVPMLQKRIRYAKEALRTYEASMPSE